MLLKCFIFKWYQNTKFGMLSKWKIWNAIKKTRSEMVLKPYIINVIEFFFINIIWNVILNVITKLKYNFVKKWIKNFIFIFKTKLYIIFFILTSWKFVLNSIKTFFRIVLKIVSKFDLNQIFNFINIMRCKYLKCLYLIFYFPKIVLQFQHFPMQLLTQMKSFH